MNVPAMIRTTRSIYIIGTPFHLLLQLGDLSAYRSGQFRTDSLVMTTDYAAAGAAIGVVKPFVQVLCQSHDFFPVYLENQPQSHAPPSHGATLATGTGAAAKTGGQPHHVIRQIGAEFILHRLHHRLGAVHLAG